jgi:hypothetical protein
MAGEIAQQFAGLPIEDLIVQPLVGMAKGQAKLNDVTWKYISDVAFEDVLSTTEKYTADDLKKNLCTADQVDKYKPTGKKKTRNLDVQLNRYVTNPDNGKQELQVINSMVPMLPLVPLPTLAIKTADINFTMEVKSTEMTKSSDDAEASIQASAEGGFWGMKYSVSMQGKISTHKENTRSTDNSAKYEVRIHAEQMPVTEGMNKLNDMLNLMIEPSVQPGQGGTQSA